MDSQCLLMDVTGQVLLSRLVRAGIHEEGKSKGSKPRIVGCNSWPICDGFVGRSPGKVLLSRPPY